MSVLHPECGAAPRSALRYRPGGTGQTNGSGPVRARQSPSRSDVRATTASVVADDLTLEEGEVYAPPRRRNVSPAPRQKAAPPARARPRVRPLLWLSGCLLLTVLLWIGITQVIAWGTGVFDLMRYGNPRTFQMDAVVGQGDSPQHPSHFVAINLHGQIVILDFPVDDPSRAREFEVSSLLGQNADQVVVTLRFLDLNHDGKPEMIIDAGETQTFLVNASGTFRPPSPSEQQQILRAFQQG
ncbi:MAG TPA: hypothetical protein VFV38_35390 [Ktedonobacteraceae bacterium]|nr:hypothetical protein [Ktedonobacteraceae bacterium]